jgi:hypothetical protein
MRRHDIHAKITRHDRGIFRAIILVSVGDTEEIPYGYPIKQGLFTLLVFLFQVLLPEGLIYFVIHKL